MFRVGTLLNLTSVPSCVLQHYHGDPYGPSCLYSDSDISNNHPGQWGWGLDGPLIFGRYMSNSQVGDLIHTSTVYKGVGFIPA